MAILLRTWYTDLFIVDRGREHEPCIVLVVLYQGRWAGVPSRRAICVDLTILCDVEYWKCPTEFIVYIAFDRHVVNVTSG